MYCTRSNNIKKDAENAKPILKFANLPPFIIIIIIISVEKDVTIVCQKLHAIALYADI